MQDGTLAARWGTGTFLGICNMTGRYLVWDGGAVAASRSVARLPDVQKWSKEAIATITMRPWQLHEAKEPKVVFQEQVEKQQQAAAEQPREARRLYIKRSDVEMYGYTQGCPKCDHDMRYGFGRTTKGHSDMCRSRIMAELAKTEAPPEGEDGGERIHDILPRAGTLVLFDSVSLPHEVLRTNRERFGVQGWFHETIQQQTQQ